MEFVATCPKGFEHLLADELRSLGVPQVRPLAGQVSFGGALTDAYRVCLWSRLASRVLAVLARVDAHDSDALYGGAGVSIEGLSRQMLHAWKLRVPHPVSGEAMEFTAPIPPDFKNLLDRMVPGDGENSAK